MAIIIELLAVVQLALKEIHLKDVPELNAIQISIVPATELALTIIALIHAHQTSIHRVLKMPSAMCEITLPAVNVQTICPKETRYLIAKRDRSNRINQNVSRTMIVPVKWLAFETNV